MHIRNVRTRDHFISGGSGTTYQTPRSASSACSTELFFGLTLSAWEPSLYFGIWRLYTSESDVWSRSPHWKSELFLMTVFVLYSSGAPRGSVDSFNNWMENLSNSDLKNLTISHSIVMLLMPCNVSYRNHTMCIRFDTYPSKQNAVASKLLMVARLTLNLGLSGLNFAAADTLNSVTVALPTLITASQLTSHSYEAVIQGSHMSHSYEALIWGTHTTL